MTQQNRTTGAPNPARKTRLIPLLVFTGVFILGIGIFNFYPALPYAYPLTVALTTIGVFGAVVTGLNTLEAFTPFYKSRYTLFGLLVTVLGTVLVANYGLPASVMITAVIFLGIGLSLPFLVKGIGGSETPA